MSEQGPGRSVWRGRTVAALAVVGVFYGAASLALTSTDSTAEPPAPVAASDVAVHDVELVGSTRTGQNSAQPALSRLGDLCRLPGVPFCRPRTVTVTRTGPTVTTTATVTQPASTVTTTVTQPVTTTVTAPAQTVTETQTTTQTLTTTVTLITG